MSADADLINGLVARLSSRLPHKTWPSIDHLHQDDIVLATKATLIEVSRASIGLVLGSLLSLLESLAHGHGGDKFHPPHVAQSELYVVGLVASCCSSHWQSVRQSSANDAAVPDPLDDGLVARVFNVVKTMLLPIPEGYVLPSQTILDDISLRNVPVPGAATPLTVLDNVVAAGDGSSRPGDMEASIKTIVEYTTASSWDLSFDFFRGTIYSIRSAAALPPAAGTVGQVAANSGTVTASVSSASGGAFVGSSFDERGALVVLRLVSFFWVDGQKLGAVIQEICSSFLHFRKPFQHTVAVVTPLLIIRWLDRFPAEFVRVHASRRRLDGGADTLFDMTQTFADGGRRRGLLYPLQTALLFLLPDVFEVASDLRDSKASSMSKKVAFLDALRKAVRNRNEQAGYCLVALLRAARHFDVESDAAIVSYAMDVQDEVRDAVFRRLSTNPDTAAFEQGLMTAAFVSLAHLNPDSCTESLIPACLAPSAPWAFKICVIQGCCYFARRNHSQQHETTAGPSSPLLDAVVPFMRAQLQTVTLSSDLNVSPESIASINTAGADGGAVTACSILDFVEASPSTFFAARGWDSDGAAQTGLASVFEAFIACVLSPNQAVQSLASRVLETLLSHGDSTVTSLREMAIFGLRQLRTSFWEKSSALLLMYCDGLGAPGSADWCLSRLHSHLQSRLLLLSHIAELSVIGDDAPPGLFLAPSRLETALLLRLCSPDVDTCQLVTRCIGVFLAESSIVAGGSQAGKQWASMLRNADIFREISSPDFHFTGPVAFQKRARALLRRMVFPTPGILSAWDSGFDKWLHLSKDVSTNPPESLDQRVLAEWRNLSGLLASLGGICTASQASLLEEPQLPGGLRWIDRASSETHEEPVLGRFLRHGVQLLACGNFKAREAIREVLSVEVPPSLFRELFRALEAELDILFSGALASAADRGPDREIVFAEQAISLLKALVERLDGPSELGVASSVRLGSLTLNFAKFLDGAADSASTLRVRIKVCQLCEAVTTRKEHLNLRDDVRVRNQLLEHVFSWIARPRSPRLDLGPGGTPSGRSDEVGRLQRDLDRACLRCLAGLTFRLPLQPGEGQADAASSEIKSQMFHTYFNRFLSLLNHELPEPSRSDAGLTYAPARDEIPTTTDLAITILSNLLSANIDVGLKHSLNIGYHENPEIRTAFVKVLHNILVQGTEFSNLNDASIMEKYDELLEVLTKDMMLATSLSAVCPSSEVDELTISLLAIFEHRGRSLDLLDVLIRQEIEETENESEILRRACVATKMLSVYSRWKGATYLKDTLQKVLERLMMTAKDLDLELDPARVDSPEELQKNAVQLKIVAKVFIDDICSSSSRIPEPFRRICNIISSAVLPRFPEAKYTAVGAFIFLRFFCPAVVAPESEGLVSTSPTKEMRRGLLLIAKVIQNLANNVLFGAKENFMFPLNDFLAENIYRVTTFLREISAPVNGTPQAGSPECYDFGSCVALHRFLYDHADHVRHRLLSQERREYARSPAEASRGRSPGIESLRNLVANLGPPPLAVSWNRPLVSNNSLGTYSRFQDFMLRNASRSTESLTASRAVYDGGENKDGLPIICVILRYMDSEGMDYDSLIYGHLKIASRMWHRPFGLLIDATCYNGQHEPSDDLFKKVESLSPAELSRSLSRIYVYNMNSAFRKCFRRLLRICTKTDQGVFHPRNVEYSLIGSLQDLQAHFHLSQLHLPKETISVVTDTRFVFQPITRLSKTKGKIEVVIKVGSQFVQVTTTDKQEVISGFRLDTTVNDIFRLGDVDEAPTSIQTEDDSAFGLRAESGKVVMYFTSPKKSDVLQTIRAARSKYGKDSRTLKSFERLIRPQDVPGTLLNLAFTNLASNDGVLRLSAYNLLGALCRAFKFEAATRIVCARDISVPMGPSRFIVAASSQIAQTEPHLTLDFVTEFFVGWDSFRPDQKPLSLAYVAPWLPGLRTGFLAADSDGDKAREKIAAVFRRLVDIAATDPSLSHSFESAIWPVVCRDEVLLEVLFDELMKSALGCAPQDDKLGSLASIVAAIGSLSLRARVISRLRKALNRSSLRPTKSLPENTVWPEICVLLRFCVSLSFDHGIQAQMFLPEIFHIVTMLSNTGSSDTRLLVYRLLVNSIHAACSSFRLDEARLHRLRASLDSMCEPRGELLSSAGLAPAGRALASGQDASPILVATESLAVLLFDTCAVAAPSTSTMNMWRSRWMSLVASTAFQNNPAVQPRAFAVMGCLARDEVDDDLLYQVLVSLRYSLARFSDDKNSDMMVSIMSSLSKMMMKLPSASRYGLQLFWLAISLLRLVPVALFNCAAQFLEAVLANNSTASNFQGEKLVSLLLQGRAQVEEAALLLDDAYGIHFNHDNFHYAVCACVVRGLTDTATRSAALRVLSAFLGLTTDKAILPRTDRLPPNLLSSPYLALILARAAGPEELKECLWLAGFNVRAVSDTLTSRGLAELQSLKDKDLLLNTAMELVDFFYLEETVQSRTLLWLNDLATSRPGVVVHLCGHIRAILQNVLNESERSSAIESAHKLLRVLSCTPRFASSLSTTETLDEILAELGFDGLWRSCSSRAGYLGLKNYFVLTGKLIDISLL